MIQTTTVLTILLIVLTILLIAFMLFSVFFVTFVNIVCQKEIEICPQRYGGIEIGLENFCIEECYLNKLGLEENGMKRNEVD